MDGLTLLQRARDAGLRVEAADTLLKISGPRKVEPLVRLLAEHKTQVLEALRKVQEVQKASQTEGDGAAHDDGPYASALAALRAKCPDHVPEERWRQAVEDGQQFLAVWGAQAQAFGWAARELFVPERPAANYSRLSRLDCTGLIWLLRGRPVIALTAMEAVMRCHSGATLTYRRRTEQALAGTANGAPATETDGTMQQTHGMVQQTDGTMQQTDGMVQPTLQLVSDAAEIAGRAV